MRAWTREIRIEEKHGSTMTVKMRRAKTGAFDKVRNMDRYKNNFTATVRFVADSLALL
jgi:hypothetical protein